MKFINRTYHYLIAVVFVFSGLMTSSAKASGGDEVDRLYIEDDSLALYGQLKLKKISFYPNPTEGLITLKFELFNSEPVGIQITDILGNVVSREQLSSNNGKYYKQINISDQSKGVYFVTISQDDLYISKKIVIQ